MPSSTDDPIMPKIPGILESIRRAAPVVTAVYISRKSRKVGKTVVEQGATVCQAKIHGEDGIVRVGTKFLSFYEEIISPEK